MDKIENLVRQKISNHPVLTNIERFVVMHGLYLHIEEPRLEIFYEVEYFDGETDVSSSFVKTGKRWIVDNNYKVNVLDENGNPIPNPDYVPEYEIIGYDEDDNPIYSKKIINIEDQYITEYAFNYFLQISFKAEEPLRIEDLVKFYMVQDDVKIKRFDF